MCKRFLVRTARSGWQSYPGPLPHRQDHPQSTALNKAVALWFVEHKAPTFITYFRE